MSGELLLLLFFLSFFLSFSLSFFGGLSDFGEERYGMGCIRKSVGYGLDDEVKYFVRVASTLVATAHGVGADGAELSCALG